LKILVTGAAGFIGYHLCELLLQQGLDVVGLDNINDYYSQDLKYARLKELGVSEKEASEFLNIISSTKYNCSFKFVRMDLQDKENLSQLFREEQFSVVVNLAAQAGVRYSIENPQAYIDSNVLGFFNVLENCKTNKIEHFIYASSSSVYGMNKKMPFETTDKVDEPISMYAATKKSNELMAYVYSHLHSLKTTGVRFFTVYGPWGRPDMAPILFADAISKGEPIKVFNNGFMERDFTYVKDIVEGVFRIINIPLKERDLYKVYNIGNGAPIKLLDFISEIEKGIGVLANKNMMSIQPGDVERTWADVEGLKNDYSYKPETTLSEGVAFFASWFKKYYKI